MTTEQNNNSKLDYSGAYDDLRLDETYQEWRQRMDPEDIAYLDRLKDMVLSCSNDDEQGLREIAEYVSLDSKVSIRNIRSLLESLHRLEGLPLYAIASAVATMGRKLFEIYQKDDSNVHIINNIVKCYSPAEIEAPDLYRGQEFSWNHILVDIFFNTAGIFYLHSQLDGTFHLNDFYSEIIDNRNIEPWNFRNLGTFVFRLTCLGYLNTFEVIQHTLADLASDLSCFLLFKYRIPLPISNRQGVELAKINRNSSKLYDYLRTQSGSDIISLIKSACARISCGMYTALLSNLLQLSDNGNSPFGAFGKGSAQAILAIMSVVEFLHDIVADPTEDRIQAAVVSAQPMVRLEQHWRRLEESWAEKSSLPMNPPVLEHRGDVLAKYGKLSPEFVDRMFRQIDKLEGDAFTDEERAEYTRMMCEGIEGGMSLTGTGRVEYPFWNSVLSRLNSDGVQDIIHVDSGASLGLVDLEIWSDERTGSRTLAGRVKKIFAVDRIPEKKLLDRVYKFDQKQYDQTLELLSVDDARRMYEEAQSQFSDLHPDAEFSHLTADTTADFNDLPAELRELEGKVILFTDMRANFLHGRSEDREKVFRNAEVLLAEGGRAYFQRGLPIYGDLVLGAVYKKISGKMEVEALQLNKQGESVSVWRLDENGAVNEDWEEQLRQVLEM